LSIVVGVDPGSLNLGYGVVDVQGSKINHLDHGTISAKRTLSVDRRLPILFAGLCEVLDRHRPDVISIEKVFHARNAQSALVLGHARGVVLLAAGQRELTLAEYAPSEVKLAVGGHGRSSKEQVAAMASRILSTSLAGVGHDSTDALAIAICHAHQLGRDRLLARSQRGGR
jgi:crossover junction endodeoxyribonuclease RuvC